ncbi:hypothetical protein SCHPADRAFT_574682 [Schizopora paradoxa]|uniref:C2H2-type domain-containing protein n=1 Tax=Schizopora paradoxa TaxID=27342 RepID=A0A0H2RWT7_9AGAM|nr:hypothetical protein SCHPADRAFT_574682 [Schizopora paradoxa]
MAAVFSVPQTHHRTMSLDRNLLNSPPPYLAFRTPDLRSHISSLPSPPSFSSPLTHSPVSPMPSPRSYRSPLGQQSYLHGSSEQQHFSSPVTPSYDVQSAQGIFSTGPGSAVSSDESHSPVDTALDADFEPFADFEAGYSYGYPTITGSGYNSELLAAVASPMNRKPQLPESEGVHVPSPYLYTNGDLPFVGAGVGKDGYYGYADDVSGQATYSTYLNGHPTIDTNISPIHVSSQQQHSQHQQHHPYAFPSTPDSPFDHAGYYSSPASAVATASIPIPAAAYHGSGHTVAQAAASPMSAHVIMGDGGCDPRFVSASPSELGSAFPGSGIPRFTGAFSSPPSGGEAGIGDGFGYDDAEGEDDEMDSGEEERSEDDDGDDEYVDSNYSRPRRFVVPSQAPRDRSSTAPYPSPISPITSTSPANLTSRSNSSSSRSAGASRSSRPCAPAPVPVPNLTKKSRGRRVPTQPVVVASNDGMSKRMRGYTCRVAGCGKCFARGEHLKRHIRSIHTNEKPHKCPQAGCGKEFSRHDNLCQHMRVHRNYSAPQA